MPGQGLRLAVKSSSRQRGASASARLKYLLREGAYAVGANGPREDLAASDSGNLPGWAQGSTRKFWAAVDRHERANARLCLQLEVNLPPELGLSQHIEIVTRYLARLCGGIERLPHSWVIHAHAVNPHAHILIQERALDELERDVVSHFKRANPDRPEWGGARKSRQFHGAESIYQARRVLAQCVNEVLSASGFEPRYDHRSKVVQRREAISQGDLRRAAELSTRTETHEGAKTHGARQRIAQGIIALADLPEPIREAIQDNDVIREYNCQLRDRIQISSENELAQFLAGVVEGFRAPMRLDGHVQQWSLVSHEQALLDNQLFDSFTHAQAEDVVRTAERIRRADELGLRLDVLEATLVSLVPADDEIEHSVKCYQHELGEQRAAMAQWRAMGSDSRFEQLTDAISQAEIYVMSLTSANTGRHEIRELTAKTLKTPAALLDVEEAKTALQAAQQAMSQAKEEPEPGSFPAQVSNFVATPRKWLASGHAKLRVLTAERRLAAATLVSQESAEVLAWGLRRQRLVRLESRQLDLDLQARLLGLNSWQISRGQLEELQQRLAVLGSQLSVVHQQLEGRQLYQQSPLVGLPEKLVQQQREIAGWLAGSSTPSVGADLLARGQALADQVQAGLNEAIESLRVRHRGEDGGLLWNQRVHAALIDLRDLMMLERNVPPPELTAVLAVYDRVMTGPRSADPPVVDDEMLRCCQTLEEVLRTVYRDPPTRGELCTCYGVSYVREPVVEPEQGRSVAITRAMVRLAEACVSCDIPLPSVRALIQFYNLVLDKKYDLNSHRAMGSPQAPAFQALSQLSEVVSLYYGEGPVQVDDFYTFIDAGVPVIEAALGVQKESVVTPQLTLVLPENGSTDPVVRGATSLRPYRLRVLITDDQGQSWERFVTVDENGNFSMTLPKSVGGAYRVEASVTDPGGRLVSAVVQGEYVRPHAQPVPPAVDPFELDGATVGDEENTDPGLAWNAEVSGALVALAEAMAGEYPDSEFSAEEVIAYFYQNLDQQLEHSGLIRIVSEGELEIQHAIDKLDQALRAIYGRQPEQDELQACYGDDASGEKEDLRSRHSGPSLGL